MRIIGGDGSQWLHDIQENDVPYNHETDARSYQRTRPASYTDHHPSDRSGNAKAILVGLVIGAVIILGFLTAPWPA